MRKDQLERIAVDVLALDSMGAVAKKHGLSPSGLYKIRQTEKFKEILEHTKKAIFGLTTAKMQTYSILAVETLNDIVKDGNAKDSDRISACRVILDGATEAYEREEVMARMEALEKMIAGGKPNEH